MRFILLLALCAGPAFADPVAPAKEQKADGCAKARAEHRMCEITIEDDGTIDGTVATAGGSVTSIWKWANAQSLIHIRRDFVPEIVKTAEDL
jgi:hypothetical protein